MSQLARKQYSLCHSPRNVYEIKRARAEQREGERETDIFCTPTPLLFKHNRAHVRCKHATLPRISRFTLFHGVLGDFAFFPFPFPPCCSLFSLPVSFASRCFSTGPIYIRRLCSLAFEVSGTGSAVGVHRFMNSSATPERRCFFAALVIRGE